MALITGCRSKGILIIVTDATKLSIVHGVHGHLLGTFLHRPDDGVALRALKELGVEFMAESDRRHTFGFVNDCCLGNRNLQMAVRAVGVRECLFPIMAGKT